MTARPRTPSLKDERIIDTAYNLPPHWRVCRGLEWGAFRTAYLAFHLRVDLETDAFWTIEEAVVACWDLERKR